jgi:hypothetical protein
VFESEIGEMLDDGYENVFGVILFEAQGDHAILFGDILRIVMNFEFIHFVGNLLEQNYQYNIRNKLFSTVKFPRNYWSAF